MAVGHQSGSFGLLSHSALQILPNSIIAVGQLFSR